MNIGWIGLGAMGSRMAQRLVDGGLRLTVYSRNPDSADRVVAAGAKRAKTPRDVAAESEIVISMVTDDEASRGVWLDGPDAAIHGLSSGAIAIESSTLSPSWIETLAATLRQKEVQLLDAPVVGTRPHADSGQLAYLVGGDSEALESVRPVLERLSRSIRYVGGNGAGATLKLLVNAMFAVQVVTLSEVIGIAKSARIEPAACSEVLQTMPVTSPAMLGIMKQIVADNFAPLFPVALVAKDLSYAERLQSALAVRPATISSAREAFDEARRAGYAGENIAAVSRLFT